MNWTPKTTNTAIISALSDYRDFVMRIATLYAGTRLVELIDLSALGSETKIAISNDFSEGMTTIRTVDQLSQSIRCGEYGQLALGLGVIQLCTAFEIFFDSVASAQGVTVSPADSFDATHSSIGGTVKLGNKTLMQIRKLHLSLGISSPMNSDEVLIKLASIIEARNCFTHAGGLVTTTKAKERLWAYRIPSTVGQPLKLNDNHLDDFLHYMAINTLAFVNNVP